MQERIKDYLKKLKLTDIHINSLQEQRDILWAKVTRVTSSSYTSIGHTNYTPDKQVNLLNKVIELDREINEEIDKFIDLREEMKDFIGNLTDVEKLVLTLRYINFKTFAEIAEKLKYSEMQIYRIHNKAIEELQQIICFDQYRKVL